MPAFAVSLALFAPGLVFFTTHYLMLRGFYALERTRTVFWVQCVIAATNIVLAVAARPATSRPSGTAPGLVIAYAGAYLVGALDSYSLLRHVLGGLETPVLVRFLVRLLIAAGGRHRGGLGGEVGLQQVWAAPAAGRSQSVAACWRVTGLVDVVVFLVLARLMRITEVTSVMSLVTGRLRR